MEKNDLMLDQDSLSVSEKTEETKKRALVIGIGGCGLRILNELSAVNSAKHIDTLAIDTDASAVGACAAKWKINAFADYNASNMPGCGGDADKGARAVSHERNTITEKWLGHDIVIVVGHLGGGTATGGMQTLVSIAKAQKIPTVFLLLTPFSFEGYPRNNKAENCISEIIQQTDVLIPVPADLLFSTCLTADVSAESAFERAAHEIAVMINGLSAMLQGYNLVGTNYASLSTVLRKKKSSCGIGMGCSSAQDPLLRSTEALEQLLSSPFLGGNEHVEKSNAIIVTLTGGRDLTIGDMKRTLELVSEHFPKGAELIFGVNTLPDAEGTLQLTALTVQYDILPPGKRSRRGKGSANADKGQPASGDEPDLFDFANGVEDGDLGLTTVDKGIFTGKPEIRFGDTDLDIPTYQRRNFHIDKEI